MVLSVTQRTYIDAWRLRSLEWKREIIERMGGRCVDCGFDDLTYLDVFDFDHRPDSNRLP